MLIRNSKLGFPEIWGLGSTLAPNKLPLERLVQRIILESPGFTSTPNNLPFLRADTKKSYQRALNGRLFGVQVGLSVEGHLLEDQGLTRC